MWLNELRSTSSEVTSIVNELRGRLRDLPGDSDLYIFCDVLKYLVRMRADVRSSIIIMIQLRYVRIS